MSNNQGKRNFLLLIAGIAIAALFINFLFFRNITLAISNTVIGFLCLLFFLKRGYLFKENGFIVLYILPAVVIIVSLLTGPLTIYLRLLILLLTFSSVFYYLWVVYYKPGNHQLFYTSSIYCTFPYLMLFTVFSIKHGDVVFLPIGLAPFLSFILCFVLFRFPNYIFRISLVVIGCFLISFYAYPNYKGIVGGSKVSILDNKYLDAVFVSDNNEKFAIKDFKEDILVFDFWFSKCGSCFRNFPKLNELSNYYRKEEKVLIASINVPIDADSSINVYSLIKEYGFAKYETSPEVAESWGIDGYPVVFVFDKKRKLRYYGEPNIGSTANNINDIIESLKKEK